jgi:hypothetical protein
VRNTLLRCCLAALALAFVATAYFRMTVPRQMTQAATAFLASLDDEQRKSASFAFDDEERFFFHFVPAENVQTMYNRPRKGVLFKNLTAPQKHLAHALIASGLSQQGAIKASTIMSLDDILRIMEKDTTGRRDSDKYFVSIFGTPSDSGTWGFRFEGHHLSLHWTVTNGQVVYSPTFFGSNPAEVREGPRKGLRVLAREEDLARDFMTMLTPEQRKAAIVDEKAPNDILTAASRVAALKGQPNGLAISKLNAQQKERLKILVDEYAGNFPDELAAERRSRYEKAAANSYFAWAGVLEKGGPHYYRIAAPDFLIEYDNTQNGANHVHSVWRDLTNDWGQDTLKAHYKTAHE